MTPSPSDADIISGGPLPAFQDHTVEAGRVPRPVRGHGALRRGQRGRERRALPLLRPLPGGTVGRVCTRLYRDPIGSYNSGARFN